jgi:hypothetical protein
MHELVSKTKYARFHGISLSDDVCETPSSMLENFCYLKPVIRKLGCHYTTLRSDYLAKWREENPDAKEPLRQIPDEVIERICEERKRQRIIQYIIQLYVPLSFLFRIAPGLGCMSNTDSLVVLRMIAIMDWEFSNPVSSKALEALDPSEVYNRVRFDMRGIHDPYGRLEGCLPYPNVTGFVGGYNAAEFSYVL